MTWYIHYLGTDSATQYYRSSLSTQILFFLAWVASNVKFFVPFRSSNLLQTPICHSCSRSRKNCSRKECIRTCYCRNQYAQIRLNQQLKIYTAALSNLNLPDTIRQNLVVMVKQTKQLQDACHRLDCSHWAWGINNTNAPAAPWVLIIICLQQGSWTTVLTPLN